MLATSRSRYRSDLDETFTRHVSLNKEEYSVIWTSYASWSGIKDSSRIHCIKIGYFFSTIYFISLINQKVKGSLWNFFCILGQGSPPLNFGSQTDSPRRRSAFSVSDRACVFYYLSYIAIAYSMGQIIKSVCVCQSVCPSASTRTVAFLDRFSPKLAQT